MTSYKTLDEYIAAISLIDYLEQFPTKNTDREWIKNMRAFAVNKLNEIQKQNNEKQSGL